MAWSKGHELKYWKKTGLKKGAGIYERYVDAFAVKHHEFDRVADVGCGPFGGVLPLLNAKEKHGFDILADEYKSLTGVQLIKYNLDAPPLQAGYDGVFCLNALDHCSNPKDGLKHLQMFLVLGGELFLHVHLRTKEQLNKAHIHAFGELDLLDWAVAARLMPVSYTVEDDWVNDEPRKAFIGRLRCL